MGGKKPEGVRDTLSDVDLDTARRRLKVPPKDLDVPDARGLVVQDPTPVTDMSQEMAFVAIGEVRKLVKNTAGAINAQAEFVRQIPDIKQCAEDAKEAAEDAKKEVMVFGVEMGGIERRVCSVEEDVPKVREDLQRHVYEGGKTRAQVQALGNNVTEAKNAAKEARSAKRGSWVSVGGMILTLGLAALGAVFFIGQLDQRVDDMDEDTEDDIERIERSVKTQVTAVKEDVKGLSKRIDGLTTAVERGGEESYCRTLSAASVRRMKRTLPRSEWPRCKRFGF